jgi:hypothetical protein
LKQTQRIEPSCALARANRDFSMDKKPGRLEWALSKIVDGARMCFSSGRHRRSARTGRRPRKLGRCSSKYPVSSANVAKRTLRALRANRVFCADKKHIRTENTVMH